MINTVNQEEVAKFSKIANEWWDKEGSFKPLHLINPLRIKYITKSIEDYVAKASNKNIKILDVGCGGGLTSIALSQIGYEVHAIDASPENINIAQIKAKDLTSNKPNFFHSSIENIDLDNKYDIVLALEILEHVDDLDNFFKYLTKALKPGGIIVISTINRNIKSYLLAIFLAEKILKWVPKNTHHFEKLVKPSEIEKLAQKSGLGIVRAKGIDYSILQQKWVMTNNLDVNYIVTIKENYQ